MLHVHNLVESRLDFPQPLKQKVEGMVVGK